MLVVANTFVHPSNPGLNILASNALELHTELESSCCLCSP